MNSDYIIATASTADLTQDYLKEHNIPYISYSYILGDEVYEDDCLEETRDKVYKRMRQGEILTTSAINAFTYREFFEGLLKTGKNVIFLDMSRALSASWRYCDEAIESLKEDYPNQKVINVDTRCVTGGLAILVTEAVKLYEAGESMDTVLEWIESHKLGICHRFTVDDLSWLRRGGRVSNASALIGTLLSIKPVLFVPDDGTLIAAAKVRGRKNALNHIIESIKDDIHENHTGMSFIINHADCYEDAVFVKNALMEAYPDIKEIKIAGLGVVIGAHTGPGLIAVFYQGGKRVE